ncbi:Flap endonuclease 1-A [Tephrocybe rancida]|nr:Flap endonuclease 1-A [Tephrocybe rancida]
MANEYPHSPPEWAQYQHTTAKYWCAAGHASNPSLVFDGKPPETKKGVLSKRFGKQDMDRFSRRTAKVTREQNEELCQRLLKGIPVIVAPSEAEAQCAELAQGGKVYAAGSEDMDTLTSSAPILFRYLTFSGAKNNPSARPTSKPHLTDLR